MSNVDYQDIASTPDPVPRSSNEDGLVPQIAFTPDPRNYIYQADYDNGLEENAQNTTGDFDGDNAIMSILKVDLDDHELMSSIEEKLNSPRTIEAMKSLGLTCKDLKPTTRREIFDYYVKREKSRDIPQALVDLRFNTINKRRFNRKEMIAEERQNIIRIEQSIQQRTSPYSVSLRGDSLDRRSMEEHRKTIHNFQKSMNLRQKSARHANISSQVHTARNVFAMNTARDDQNNCATSTETGRTRFRNHGNTHRTHIPADFDHGAAAVKSTSTTHPFPKWVNSSYNHLHNTSQIRNAGGVTSFRSHHR